MHLLLLSGLVTDHREAGGGKGGGALMPLNVCPHMYEGNKKATGRAPRRPAAAPLHPGRTASKPDYSTSTAQVAFSPIFEEIKTEMGIMRRKESHFPLAAGLPSYSAPAQCEITEQSKTSHSDSKFHIRLKENAITEHQLLQYMINWPSL